MFIDLTGTLNRTIKNAADAAGVQYVDVADALIGHRLCETNSADVAVNGVTAGTDQGFGKIKIIGAESYHPNTLGHALLLQTILARTHNLRNDNPSYSAAPAATTAPFPYSTAPKTGRSINLSVPDAGLLPTSLTSGISLPLTPSPTAAVLRSSAPYIAKLEDGTQVGSALTDSLGRLSGSVTVPAAVKCGYHVMHLYGPNILGQNIDITKVVYVGTSSQDCDGNGQSDDAQSCGLLLPAGRDVDMDGIDDGCDPLISDPPTGPTQKVYLLQSTIHATRQ